MKRLDLILNGKGGVGKSFFAVNFVQFLKDKGIAHVAIDSDNENSTLKRFHPDTRFLDLDTRKIAVGRSLLPHERTSMNATATIECQTLDVKSSATELGVCEETVRRLVRRKILRKLPGLRRVLIPRTELDRYLNNGNHARLS